MALENASLAANRFARNAAGRAFRKYSENSPSPRMRLAKRSPKRSSARSMRGISTRSVPMPTIMPPARTQGFRRSRERTSYLLQFTVQLRRKQSLVSQVVVQKHAHQKLALLLRTRVGKIAALDIDQ